MNRTRRQTGGFTLLEAVIALTIFSMSALALLGWLSVNVQAIEHAERRRQQLDDVRSGMAVMETINPMAEPTGERRLPGLTVRWQAEPIADRRNGKGPSGGQTIFDLALYQINVELIADGEPPSTFQVRRAGWETVRAASAED